MIPEATTSPLQVHRRVLKNVVKAVKCDINTVKQRVPISQWLPKYNRQDIVPDLIAGITVGLTLIPQSIAYAGLAGLDPQYGLYSAFMGSFIYIIFGTTKEVNLGPVSLLSLLTFNYTHHLGANYAVLLCFLSGCIELLCGLLHLGFLVEFVSTPVVSGFTAAAAVTIASSQVKSLLGIKFESNSFIQTWTNIFAHIGETKLWDAVLGGICCVVLISLKMMKDYIKIGDGQKTLTRNQKIASKFIWFISTARNAIVVFFCAGLSYYFTTMKMTPYKLTGRVKSGLPPFQPPPFSTQVGNKTLNFEQMVSGLGSGVIVIPIVAIIENIAIGKAFAKGRILDATQEMMTLGLCNIAGSFVSSMPVTGSFSRSAVCNASGIRSPLAGLYTGVMVLLSLTFLTPYFFFIPSATLAAVIVCAVIYLIEYEVIIPMWKISKPGLVTLFTTFVVCLLVSMEIGIAAGIAVDVIFLLYNNARPKVNIEVISSTCGPEYILASPKLGLLFPAVDFVRSAIQAQCERIELERSGQAEQGLAQLLPVVLDCKNVHKVDFTSAEGLESLISDLKLRGRVLIFLNVNSGVLRVLTAVCHHDLHVAASETELGTMLRGARATRGWSDWVLKGEPDDAFSDYSNLY